MRSRILVRLIRSSPRVLSAARLSLRALPPPAPLQLRIATPLQHQFRPWSSSQPPLADPSRPDLFYHLLPPDPSQSIPVYALSFLPSPPPSSHSATILGWLPAVTEAATEDVDAGLNDFVENSRFRPLLHEAVQQALREGVDDVWTNSAIQIQQGWMHIHDYRNVPALGRIGDPDDIIASVLVQDSKILPDTYQAMPSYRFCTADGPTQLTEGLEKKLKSLLEKVAARESR
ncbi:hypothetical protein JVT61DRAFT_8250 [Boletus reticuloceps]|uniref:Uncharacterized protein n=1 Tax=Boletus reticuloceps TaxID=495285 RepID=A0A8I3ACC0_9AGAM|nr:hypothetical protein JVT61DRAFT_8250 [Boletus reticuloceps]